MEDQIEIYSEEVQNIIESRPNWLIRNSIISIFLVLVITLVVTNIIRYPETTKMQAFKIESLTPGYQFISKTQGNLKLLKKNHEIVDKGDWIAYIENTIDIQNIRSVSQYIENAIPFIESESFNNLTVKKDISIGELEIHLNNFNKSLESLQTYLEVNPESYQIKSNQNDIASQKSQIQIKKDEIKELEENLELQRSNMESYKKLFEKGYVSRVQFENVKIAYNEKEREYLNLLSSIESYTSNIVKSKDQSSQIRIGREINIVEMKRNTVNSFSILKEELERWKENNIFIAPYQGEIDYLKVWNDNHFVVPDQHLITLKPMYSGALGRGFITGINLGKVEVGQKVIIKLDGYVSTEYGVLEGVIKDVSSYPNSEGFYTVVMDLPKNLETSYGFAIPFRPELSGQAEIVLKDQSLFELFIKNFMTLIEDGNS